MNFHLFRRNRIRNSIIFHIICELMQKLKSESIGVTITSQLLTRHFSNLRSSHDKVLFIWHETNNNQVVYPRTWHHLGNLLFRQHLCEWYFKRLIRLRNTHTQRDRRTDSRDRESDRKRARDRDKERQRQGQTNRDSRGETKRDREQ